MTIPPIRILTIAPCFHGLFSGLPPQANPAISRCSAKEQGGNEHAKVSEQPGDSKEGRSELAETFALGSIYRKHQAQQTLPSLQGRPGVPDGCHGAVANDLRRTDSPRRLRRPVAPA